MGTRGPDLPQTRVFEARLESGPEEAKAPTVGTIPALPGGKAGSALAHVSCPTLSGGGVLGRLADPPNPDHKLDNKPGKDVA